MNVLDKLAAAFLSSFKFARVIYLPVGKSVENVLS
jgi:hypothetical protein